MLKLQQYFRFSIYAAQKTFKMTASETQKDIKGLRIPYHSEEVKEDFSEKDPLKLFDVWFDLARKTDGIKEANAMAVATADLSGKPSMRYVLLKSYGKDGFCFFTNYESRKGKEIAVNPNVSLLFYWEPLCRQIRIEGTVEKIDEKESEEYFHSRPRSSQISAAISNQSAVIESNEVLQKRYHEFAEKYADESIIIPKPNCWGGYRVMPSSFEFWCGRTSRLHDRIRFRHPTSGEVPDNKLSHSGENGWIYEYLSP